MNVYDFDKTIYRTDSSTDFFIYCMFRHPRIFTLLPSITAGFFKFYILKKGTKTQFKEKIMKFVRYIDKDKDLKNFWNKKKKHIKSYYLNQQKEDDVIISASPVFLLRPICSELGIKHLIASEVDDKSGKFSRPNCHGKEKVLRYREVFSDAIVDEFYSDSYSDTPLAEIAKKAYMVKGDMISPWKFR